MSKTITITASDGQELAGHLFEAESAKGSVVIAPAMAVPQHYYHKYAAHLCQMGFNVVTFDYRGTNLSKETLQPHKEIRMSDWAVYDLNSVFEWVKSSYPDLKLFVVSQSAGGQLVGITPNNHLIDGMILVTSQSGYWKHWSGREKLMIWLLWHCFIPAITPFVQVFPSKLFGIGNEIPSGVAKQWALWGRHPDYILSHDGDIYFKQFKAPILCYSFSDDSMLAPEPAVQAILDFYENASATWHHLTPQDLSEKAIGHFGFFRQRFAESLWRESLEWLEEQVG